MILRGEVLSPDAYDCVRGGVRAAMAAASRVRRIEVCPGLDLYFENRGSLWFHLHELLHATNWDERAIREELSQINQLVPAECGLVATIASDDDAGDQASRLMTGTWSLRLCGHSIRGRDMPMRGADALSGMRHLFFGIEPVQALLLKTPGIEVDVCVNRGDYVHWISLGEPVRQAMASDLNVHFRVEAY